MPIPRPNSGEKQSDFVSRCHSALTSDHPDNDQRHAICMDAWRDVHMRMSLDQVRAVCPECAERMQRAGLLELTAGGLKHIFQDDPDRICGSIWSHGSDEQRAAFGGGTAGRERGESPPSAWWDECTTHVKSSYQGDPGAHSVFVPGAIRRPSHRITYEGDRVIVHDLELFVGFDPAIDAPDSQLRRYDETAVRGVVGRTQEFIARGQQPKLILGHNRPGDQSIRPAIGTIPSVRFGMVSGVPGVIGDVEMDRAVFAEHIASNAYPRRSAEIWQDGYLSEVALLGSKTPGRPLPDTYFGREGPDHGLSAVCFSRDLPVLLCPVGPQYDVTTHPPAPTGGRSMTDAEKAAQELVELKKSIFERDAEIERLKVEAARHLRAAEDRERQARGAEGDRETFAREVERSKDRITALETQLRKERYGRKIDELISRGYQLDPKQIPQMLERIVSASDPEAEFNFVKSLMHRDPINTRIDQRFAIAGAADAKQTFEREQRAADAARDKCVSEGKSDNYTRYFDEAMKTA